MAGKRHPQLSDVETILADHIPDNDARTGLLALFTAGLVELAVASVEADNQGVVNSLDGTHRRHREPRDPTRPLTRLIITTPLPEADGTVFERVPLPARRRAPADATPLRAS